MLIKGADLPQYDGKRVRVRGLGLILTEPRTGVLGVHRQLRKGRYEIRIDGTFVISAHRLNKLEIEVL